MRTKGPEHGRHRAFGPARALRRTLGLALAATFGAATVGVATGARAQSAADIVYTAHNLSVTGTGEIRATGETRICVFCHTPHNAAPLTPLWNRNLEPTFYNVYTSPTLAAGPLPQPSGATKLCLGCHDGTIAMGAVLNPARGITMAGQDTIPFESLSNFGVDLSGHHPVSFSYQSSLPNPELAPTPPTDLVYGASDEVHCTTCHDPHDDQWGKFLVKDNRYSALCTSCHDIDGWEGSAHATSPASVAGVLPRPPKTWPNYGQLNEWGCEACHTPHFAPTAPGLLNFTGLPPEPFSCTSAGCHSSEPPPAHLVTGGSTAGAHGAVTSGAGAAIAAQVRKPSAHHERPGASQTQTVSGGIRSSSFGVSCVDCHNPHRSSDTEAEAPHAGGALAGVSGVDRNGAEVSEVRYEYEVCLKCHGDQSSDFDFVPRVVPDTNKRRAFDPGNPSFHPVMAMGRATGVPSIPSALEPSMTASTMMYCSTCHADDEGGSGGPHGSTYAPILRQRYDTADNTRESFENYALCYQCHDRSSILSDQSFRSKTMGRTRTGGGHRGHLEDGAPCSACHDPHGVSELDSGERGATGSHSHLVNFDKTIVAPRAGATYPVFTDKGMSSGSCSLVCHGFDHDGTSYP
jgi:predicted CXXCH cytochrome family protein